MVPTRGPGLHLKGQCWQALWPGLGGRAPTHAPGAGPAVGQRVTRTCRAHGTSSRSWGVWAVRCQGWSQERWVPTPLRGSVGLAQPSATRAPALWGQQGGRARPGEPQWPAGRRHLGPGQNRSTRSHRGTEGRPRRCPRKLSHRPLTQQQGGQAWRGTWLCPHIHPLPFLSLRVGRRKGPSGPAPLPAASLSASVTLTLRRPCNTLTMSFWPQGCEPVWF